MKTLGIIVEYNPLHNGHVHHWKESLRITGAQRTVAVMSGPFLQRGEPAITDKWSRTEMALAMGVDLVLELPVAYAVQPAEWFARGAVTLLCATGIVDALCFGSESGDIAPLHTLACVLAAEPAELKAGIAQRLSKGASYPAAYAGAAV
ncbi:nucleotidyltransferase family protein, partial [Paenibacillus polymyxa]|uniref:nucleotidyltransferase family protein n=1 Tax=Paenibacillus polymyxa TaxID=1406 RepID=UPI003D2C426C